MAEFGPDRTAAVEGMLSRQFGGAVIKLRSVSLMADASSSRAHERSFWRLRISGCRHYKKLHAKVISKRHASSERVRQTIRLEAGLAGRGLPVPDFLGSVPVEPYNILLWEHREGASSQNFRDLKPTDAERIAHAVAQVSAVSSELGSDLGLEKGIKWVQPVSSRILRTLSRKEFSLVGHQFEEFAAIERDVIARLNAIEAETLTHNDVKAPNVLVDPKAITLVDWESATLGPHGASLRRFTRHGQDIERVAAQGYVRALMQHGIKVDLAQVLFVMRFQEIFWGLCTGVRTGQSRRIMKTLEFVPEVLARPESY